MSTKYVHQQNFAGIACTAQTSLLHATEHELEQEPKRGNVLFVSAQFAKQKAYTSYISSQVLKAPHCVPLENRSVWIFFLLRVSLVPFTTTAAAHTLARGAKNNFPFCHLLAQPSLSHSTAFIHHFLPIDNNYRWSEISFALGGKHRKPGHLRSDKLYFPTRSGCRRTADRKDQHSRAVLVKSRTASAYIWSSMCGSSQRRIGYRTKLPTGICMRC